MIHTLLMVILLASVSCRATFAQPKPDKPTHQTSAYENQDSSAEMDIRNLEQQVDDAIRTGDTAFLQSVYSDDFRFMHFNGEITNKTESLQQVAKRPYTLRRLDAVKIELHGDVAVTEGLVDISARGDHGNHSYLLKYIRVYQRRNGHWQMLMQHSVGETSPIAFDIPSPK